MREIDARIKPLDPAVLDDRAEDGCPFATILTADKQEGCGQRLLVRVQLGSRLLFA
jgi:hypothetical protein